MAVYKALYKDEDDDEAIEEALCYEKEHGILWKLHLLDNDYSEVRSIWT